MDIYPQDLGPQLAARLTQLRVALADRSPTSYQRLVTIMNGKTPVEASQTILSRRVTLYAGFFGGVFALILGCLALPTLQWGAGQLELWTAVLSFGVGGGAYLLSHRRRDKTLRGKVTEQEIVILRAQKGHDAVTQELLQIVPMLLSLVPSDAEAAKSIQSALRCLGTAIDKLPALPAEGVFADAVGLRADALRLTQEARSETDTVIAASLERQAEALMQRAETTARAAILVRRNQVLRDEVAAQVKTFRTSLAAAQITRGQIGKEFDTLAESITQVAQEANALADARAELDTTLAPTPFNPEGATLNVGNTG